jgi:putative restriction endonuclease
MPIGSSASMSYPFYHLETSGFWHLVSTQDEDHHRGRVIKSIKRLLELYQGAKFDDNLFILLNNREYRHDLRSILINHYFAPEIHQGLWDQSTINTQSEAYYYNILEHPEEPSSIVADMLIGEQLPRIC